MLSKLKQINFHRPLKSSENHAFLIIPEGIEINEFAITRVILERNFEAMP